MAPFIPEGIVNPDLNLFFALVLGLGFGYVLEQAGFSSSRKLAGVFYGYDFVVLRVFFTAGVTAMVGLLFMGYMGWIDMSLVYINPTYLWSAIVGGLIMGVGFIFGGYCPGTSIVAATTGKIDAMLFLFGAMIGIFIFGHFYNDWEPFFNGYYLGSPFVFDSLGISKAWFAFLMVMMAIAAFAITQIIEDKVNNTPEKEILRRPSYIIPGALLIIAMFTYIFLPEERKSNTSEIPAAVLHSMLQDENRFVSAEEAVYKLIRENSDLILIDVRSPEDFAHFALPGAVNIPLGDILGRRYRSFFNDSKGKKVFYGFSDASADLSWAIAARAGFSEIYVLRGGLNGMFDMLFNGETTPKDPLNQEQEFNARFIAKARQMFMEGTALPNKPAPATPVRKIVEIVASPGGGC
jgi:rhodanese-related sulfurtransferase/uncharacterized membrane protein YedE/YeeE